MKTKLIISVFLLVAVIIACEKRKPTPSRQNAKNESLSQNYGPYGKLSKWKSISGDTIFSDTLTLSFFYTEKASPCDICYYQQNYSLWNDYDYTFAISKCASVGDTLVMKDPDTFKKTVFTIIK